MANQHHLSQNSPSNNSTNDQPTLTIDTHQDVIPIYNSKKPQKPPNKIKLTYDILMLVAILVDLLLIFFDQIMMSSFIEKLASYFEMSSSLSTYKSTTHGFLGLISGLFTLFLMIELSLRWLIAIKKKTYYRWFFFPFVHWYEVLGCFPLLRPLRLLRAIILIRRLHELGINIIPARWIKSAKFYGHVLLEELSDRVILTAIGNFKMQLKYSKTHQSLIQQTIDKHRHNLEQAILSVLKEALVPKIQDSLLNKKGNQLAKDIGLAVEDALKDIPELRKYLKLIPIAGSMIESQMVDIGRHIGENVTTAVSTHIFSEKLLNELMQEIAHGLTQLDTTNPILSTMAQNITNDVIDAFEAQVKIQQWKHTQHIPL